ncbi:MAG: hypothetical protein Q4A15_07855 [Prevotellaceae bacterium]|nr:hypothetical protein [Prevotellaceae bacterium]
MALNPKAKKGILEAFDEKTNKMTQMYPETTMEQIVDMKVKLSISPETNGLRVTIEDE